MEDIEEAVWAQAQACYDAAMFRAIVKNAVQIYGRRPGLDALTRLHANSIGAEATQMLYEMLGSKDGVSAVREQCGGFVSLRQGLRTYLRHTLQMRLIVDGFASDALTTDLLETDLGI